MDAPAKRPNQPGGVNPTRRKVVEEPFDPAVPPPAPTAAAPRPHLVGSIVEKGFSAPAPSSSPRPTVLPFPVARHRSHGPHWGPTPKNAGNDGADEEDDEMDVDETDYLSVVAAAAAGRVRRKEKKGMDFSRWQEFVGDAPPKWAQGKPAQVKKQNIQKVDAGAATSKVGAAVAGRRELEGGGMLLDSSDARRVSSAAALVTDVALKKQIVQVQSRDETKASVVSDVSLREDDMDLDGGQPSMEAEINAENMSRLAEMSAGEIAEAQEEILNRMDPKLVEMLKHRGKEKSGEKKGGDRDKGWKNSGPSKAAKAIPGDWSTAGEYSGQSWKAWSDRVERIRSCRFSLEGEILGFQSQQEQQDGKKTHAESVAERDFLRTEGDPAAVGYTINEAVTLTRSMVPGQRVLALQLLASILNRALQSLHKMDLTDNGKEMNSDAKFYDWQAVWAYALGPEPELVLSLRMTLDYNHDSVVLSCAKVINVMLSCEFNERYFDFSEKVTHQGKDICMSPVFRSKPDLDGGFLEGGFWKYNTKPSNILPHYGDNDEEEDDEKHTIHDDIVVSGQDIAAGFVRMGILPRICFLLEMEPSPALEDHLVSILVALARHSPQSADAILNCPQLIESVTKLLTKQGSMDIHSSQIKGVTLLKVLSKYNRQTCLKFVNHGVFQQAMWHWYRKACTLEDWVRSGKEQCKLSSAMMVEQLRLWRTCISYGFCIAHFTDFFPVLCLWLSPPMFQKLSENNVLFEFSSIARESYLVLGVLAQRLPLLHSVEQLSKQDVGVSVCHVETWSWSHVVPMVDLALSWLHLNEIPCGFSLANVENCTDYMLESNHMVLVIASVLGMLNSVLERISPDGTPDDNYWLPWIPDFVPKIGLGIINNGFFSFSGTDAVGYDGHLSFNGASLVKELCYMRCHGGPDASLSSISCLQRLLQLSLSIDRVIQKAIKKGSENLKDYKTGMPGKILREGISSLWHNDLLDLLTLLLPIISSQVSVLQSIEMFGRGGPAPGVGFGWGACSGGFWSLNCLLAQSDSQLILDLIKNLSAAPRGPFTHSKGVNTDNVTNTAVTASDRISSVLGVSLIAGPGQVSMLEKAFDILFESSILKGFKSSIHDFVSEELQQDFKWDISEDEYLLFSSALNSHFRSRWLAIKKHKHAGNNSNINVPKPETLETIQEETELAEVVNQPCSTLAVEWAHQRLPLPMHWILSAVCSTDDPKGTCSASENYNVHVSRAGLIFLLGLEAVSAAPCLHTPLVWKMHALSVSIRSSMDLLQEDRSRDIFHVLQELYGQHLNRLCQKYNRSQHIKKDECVGISALEEDKQIDSLDFLRFQEKIHGSYTTFVESLVEQFAGVSYGDVIFGRQVAIYLHRRVEPTVRLASWNALSNAYALELLPPLDKCIGDMQGYLEPLEDDERILESYAKSWTSGVLDKAAPRDSMAFVLAKHHLSGFVFQCSASGKTLQNKLVKSLVRCYAQKRHHEAMLKSLVLQGVAQDSRSSTELDRRFKILKEACEMNSSLLTEVQRLKTSLGQ